MEEGEAFVSVFLQQKRAKAREMIAKNPQLIWTARGMGGRTPAYWAAYHGDVEMLQHMHDVILSLREPQNQQQILRDTFERGNDDNFTPAHRAAVDGHVNCLAFLVKHAPSGVGVLEVKNEDGFTPAHLAAYCGHVDALDFIMRNAPSGVGVLGVKNSRGQTPLDFKSKSIKGYFTPQKIKKIGFERELHSFEEHIALENGSFVALVLEIVKSNLELALRNNL